jgi:Tfp pilus assembly protein PilE
MLETSVDSFIVRFVQEQKQTNGPSAVAWHGVIRHVQSKEEIRFTQIEDALRFVANYVELSQDKPSDSNQD